MSFAAVERGFATGSKVSAIDEELIQDRLKHLEAPERVMIELVLFKRATLREVGEFLRVHPGVVHRRIQNFRRRCQSPIVALMCLPGVMLDPDVQRVGMMHHLLGLSRTAIAGRLGVPVRQVSGHLNTLRGFAMAWPKARQAHRLMHSLQQ